MDKQAIVQQVIERLGLELQAAEQAARVAHETATHEENIAENKYDTLGLEAAYLAAGQARRVEEIGRRLRVWRQLQVRPYDDAQGIRLTSLVLWPTKTTSSNGCFSVRKARRSRCRSSSARFSC